jgi:hypothetical protein
VPAKALDTAALRLVIPIIATSQGVDLFIRNYFVTDSWYKGKLKCKT